MGTAGVEARLWRAFAQIVEYPTEGVADAAHLCAALLEPSSAGAAAAMARFAVFTRATRRSELEEAYTRTFDLDQSRCPYVGFHLFGESYKRSVFLLRLKAEARSKGVDLGTELADHLAILLRLLATGADLEFKVELATEALMPALRRMQGGAPSDGAAAAPADPSTAYRTVLDALLAALERYFPTPPREPGVPAVAPAPEPAR